MNKNLLLENFYQFSKSRNALNDWEVPLDLEEKLVVVYLLSAYQDGHVVTSQDEIAQLIGVEKSKMTRLLDKLENKKIVERVRNKSNRRRNIINLMTNFKFEE